MTGPGFDALLERGASLLLAAGALWALAIVLAVALEARTAGRIAVAPRLGCPRSVRRWLLPALTVVLVGSQPATAREAIDPPVRSLDGLAVPTRIVDPVEDAQISRAQAMTAVSTTVRVRPGDTLWGIARRVLPDEVPEATVAAAARSLYAGNRIVIGADPDRLHPGQILSITSDLPGTARNTDSEEP